MSINSTKRYLRKHLPPFIFKLIQKIRLISYKPPAELALLEERFNQLQPSLSDAGMITLREGLTLKVDPQSKEPFTWFCWRSPEMVKELSYFITSAQGLNSFVDVGANHGIFSLVFLKLNPNGKVLSIDPSPIADAIRRSNIHLNGMEESSICSQVACGSKESSIKMHFNWHHLEVSGKGDENLASLSIKVRPLDALCYENDFTPDVVKIDVEGYELEVLKGAEITLQSATLLLLEIHPELLEKLNVNQAEIYEWLFVRKWRVRSLCGQEISRADFCDKIHTFWTICER